MLSTYHYQQVIRVSDRATILNMMMGIRGYVYQLQAALYMSSRNCEKMHRPKRYPGIDGVCPVSGRAYHCRRNRE